MHTYEKRKKKDITFTSQPISRFQEHMYLYIRKLKERMNRGFYIYINIFKRQKGSKFLRERAMPEKRERERERERERFFV